MSRLIVFIVSLFMLFPYLPAQNQIPIKEVRLYKNGMAYIVRSGRIENPLSVSFPVKDMNDILKTFSAWNPESRTLYPTGYTAGIPINQLLSRYPFSLQGRETGLGDFLKQVRGTGLVLKTGTVTAKGTLMTVKTVARSLGDTTVEDQEITLLREDGPLFKCLLSEIREINLADQSLNGQLKDYLQTMTQGIEASTAEITVYPEPEEGPLRIAYLQQFPVWKSTYRLDLEDKSIIQGWAQVDNPSGEAWDEVGLTLVSGAPSSFITELYMPMYASRSEVELPGSQVPLAPIYESTLRVNRMPVETNSIYGIITDTSGGRIPGVIISARDSMGRTKQTKTDEQGYYELTGLVPGSCRLEAGLTGFRKVSDGVQLPDGERVRHDFALIVGQISETSVGGRGSAPRALAMKSIAADSVPPSPSEEVAIAEEIQDYFEYSFPYSVSLEPGQSARVPFLSREIKASRVSVLSPSQRYPYYAVELENNTGQPMDAGPLTVFQQGSYSGETMMAYLGLGEKRLLSYGIDKEIENASSPGKSEEKMVRLVVDSGVMFIHWKNLRETRYLLKNKADEEKHLILEHPKVADQDIQNPEVDEETAGYYRFRIKLGPGEERSLPIREILSTRSSILLRDFGESDLVLYFSARTIPDSLLKQLKRIIEMKREIDRLRTESSGLANEHNAILKDQERYRENLKALGTSEEEKSLRKRYLNELSDQEDRLTQLREKNDQLNRQISIAEQRRNEAINTIQWQGEITE